MPLSGGGPRARTLTARAARWPQGMRSGTGLGEGAGCPTAPLLRRMSGDPIPQLGDLASLGSMIFWAICRSCRSLPLSSLDANHVHRTLVVRITRHGHGHALLYLLHDLVHGGAAHAHHGATGCG